MPILHKQLHTHYANLMMQFMVGYRFREQVPGLQLSNFEMPYWGISFPEIPTARNERTLMYSSTWTFDSPRLSYLLNHRLCDRISWIGWGQRMEYFPDKETCRNLFCAAPEVGVEFGAHYVVCPVRAAELLDGIHLYPLIPVSFYRDMIGLSGCTPVFIGQTDENLYTAELRGAFPKAQFLPSQGPLGDFQTIRKAANIILPVSTFTWLAAWLSHARRIVVPVFGFFDSSTGCDLLPLSEPHYEFWRLPQLPASPVQEALREHKLIEGRWNLVSRDSLIPERGQFC
jgi:hypothetical protein